MLRTFGATEVASSLGNGWSVEKVEKVIGVLKRNGLYDQYKNMPYDVWENTIKSGKTKGKKKGRPKKDSKEPTHIEHGQLEEAIKMQKENKEIQNIEPEEDKEDLVVKESAEYYKGKADAFEGVILYLLGEIARGHGHY